MKRAGVISVLAAALIGVPSSLTAQDALDAALDAAGQEQASGAGLAAVLPELDFRNIDLLDALKFVAQRGDLNLVATPAVTGRVTLFVKNITVKDALDLIVLIGNIAYQQRGNIITVMTREEYAQRYGQEFQDQRQVKTIQLLYANVPDVAALLGNIKSAIGKIIADDGTGTLVLVDVPEKLVQMEATIKLMDIPTVKRVLPTMTKSFELQYAKADEVAPEVQKLLTTGIGSLTLDKRTNSVIVTDLPLRLRDIKRTIDVFDGRTRQVFIEARILKVILSDEHQTGVDWEQIFALEGGSKDAKFVGKFPLSATGGGKLVIGQIGQHDFAMTLQLLETVGKTETLSSPHIAAVNNQEAKILVGTKEAYVTSTVTQAQATATTAEQVTFIDVGTSLAITPVINREGFVTMKIKPEISQVKTTLTTGSGNKIPIVETSSAETVVMVKDGLTIVIGGLMKDEVKKTENKIPVLGDAPLIGRLFRTTDETKDKEELVIFLTPHIMRGDEPVPITVTSTQLPSGMTSPSVTPKPLRDAVEQQ